MLYPTIKVAAMVFVMVIAAGLFLRSVAGEESAAQPANPWEKDIQAFEAGDAQNTPAKDAVLFVGSSTIRMWPTAVCFPEYTVMNRGFGGCAIPDVLTYMDRIVIKYKPKVIVFYCGDNDIASNMTPETVAANFQKFAEKAAKDLPGTPLIFIPIKPSGARWELWPKMKQANELIQAYCAKQEKRYCCDLTACLLGADGKPADALFLADKLHLSPAGYKAWSDKLRVTLKTVLAAK